jgi:nickel-dependent lactate racemase
VTEPALQFRTAAWYGDQLLDLELPATWNVSVHSPSTRAPLSDAEIAERLESPVAQPPIRELCRGKTRPLVIVDDLNRATPASRVLPTVVRQFTDAGIPRQNITILLGSGTHGMTDATGAAKKVGAELAESCRVRIHDCNRNLKKVGRTSFGTPVVVSRDVLESDFLVAVGGLYPNYTAGFGGGSKAALGVLGLRSIAALHFGHRSAGRAVQSADNTFRSDIDEIARMLGLGTGVFVAVDADRRIVELVCGDVRELYGQFLESTKEAYRAPRPDVGVNLVISNAYPIDLSLTFVRMKAMAPISAAPRSASSIVVASCEEGIGFHGLFPFMNAPRFHRQRMLGHRVAANLHEPRAFASKAARRLARWRRPTAGTTTRRPPKPPTWLYCPSPIGGARLPAEIPGFRVSTSWPEIVSAVEAEQAQSRPLRACVYTAAPLQWFA